MRSVAAAPMSVRSFIIRANGSTMKLSWNRVADPSPPATNPPATTRSRIVSHNISSPRSRLVATPSMSRANAPQLRISSGSATWRLSASGTGPCSSTHQSEPRLLGGGKARVIALDQLIDRHGRGIEDRCRIDAEQDGERDEWRHDCHLAQAEIGDEFEARLLEFAENDAAVEVKRVGRRQDHTGRSQERNPGVDAERSGQAQELADEAARAGEADIGEGK